VAALFERADIDGDGLLDPAELDAEKALRRVQTLDTGEMAEAAFLTRATPTASSRPKTSSSAASFPWTP
jgi:hypothetical protein